MANRNRTSVDQFKKTLREVRVILLSPNGERKGERISEILGKNVKYLDGSEMHFDTFVDLNELLGNIKLVRQMSDDTAKLESILSQAATINCREDSICCIRKIMKMLARKLTEMMGYLMFHASYDLALPQHETKTLFDD